MADKLDQKLRIDPKPKRVDFREFQKSWSNFNKNINKFFEENKDSPMGLMEDDEPELGGIDEDDVDGGGKRSEQ